MDDDNDTTITNTNFFAKTKPKKTKRIETRIPILGSIQLQAGESRLQKESTYLQEKGYYTGAILRHSCLPQPLQDGLLATKTAPSISQLTTGTGTAGITTTTNKKAIMNTNNAIEFLGPFWSSCLFDLKSTKSKSFSFRSKNHMDKSIATQWGNYQKSVIDSGALGDPNESHSIVNEASGEYKGFA